MENMSPCVIKVVGKSDDVNIVSMGIVVNAITNFILICLDKESKIDIIIEMIIE